MVGDYRSSLPAWVIVYTAEEERPGTVTHGYRA